MQRKAKSRITMPCHAMTRQIFDRACRISIGSPVKVNANPFVHAIRYIYIDTYI